MLKIPKAELEDRLAGGQSRQHPPPPGWRKALACLAREQGSTLGAMAKALETEDGASGAEYDILQTHMKYIMFEERSELIKLRKIRTRKALRELVLDRYPAIGSPDGEREPPIRHFYSLPGTATRRKDGDQPFIIDLHEGEVFEADQEYAIVFGYLVELPLVEIHPDPERESLEAHAPLGRDLLRIEMHLPKTRRFGAEDEVEVYAHYPDREMRLTPGTEYVLKIDDRFKNVDGSPSTDVLRLRMHPPEGVRFVRVVWPWTRV
ncbi:MAG TPA: hypothetical protein VF584_13760 [Longimicrobium sp.]